MTGGPAGPRARTPRATALSSGLHELRRRSRHLGVSPKEYWATVRDLASVPTYPRTRGLAEFDNPRFVWAVRHHPWVARCNWPLHRLELSKLAETVDSLHSELFPGSPNLPDLWAFFNELRWSGAFVRIVQAVETAESPLAVPASLAELSPFQASGPPPPGEVLTEQANTFTESSSSHSILLLRELVPKPCGHRHGSLRAIYRCVTRNGVPGFEVRQVPEGGVAP